MRIVEVTFRLRNDFHFVAQCVDCGKKSSWGDGYADAYYQTRVFPARPCPHCGLNDYGLKDGREPDVMQGELAALVEAEGR